MIALQVSGVYVRQCQSEMAERILLGFLRAHREKSELRETVMSRRC